MCRSCRLRHPLDAFDLEGPSIQWRCKASKSKYWHRTQAKRDLDLILAKGAEVEYSKTTIDRMRFSPHTITRRAARIFARVVAEL